MKKMSFFLLLSLAASLVAFDVPAFVVVNQTSSTTAGPSSSTATTNTTESTTTTTTEVCGWWWGSCVDLGTDTTVTKTTNGTIPGDSSGMNFTCSEAITNGISSVKTSVMDVPSSFVSGLFGDVLSATGLSMGMSPIVSKVLDLLRNRAADLCNRAVPLVVDPSGAESSTMIELNNIIGQNSSYVTDLANIAGQMSTLAATAAAGGVTQTEAQNLFNQFNTLQADQLNILENMDQEMDQLSTQHAETISAAPPKESTEVTNIASTIPGCTDVPVADIANPTAPELAAMSSYLVCTQSVSGACCTNSCDAIESIATPGAPTQAEITQTSTYGSGCVPLDSVGSQYCCFN